MLPQQADVNRDPQRHPTVGGGLKFQQQQQVGIATGLQRNPPDHVAVAALTGLGVEFGIDPFHLAQFQVADPWLRDEFAQQLGDQSRVTEEPVVEGIMIGHPPLYHG
jgi:hypothetical protein